MSFLFDQVFETFRDHAGTAVGTVVRRDVQIAHLTEFFLENDKILILRADNRIGGDAVLMQPFHLRINRGGSDTAGDEDDFLFLQLLRIHIDQIRGFSQRSDEIFKGIALAEILHALRRRSDRLKYDRDRPLVAVVIADRERNPLTFLVNLHDHELTGLTMSCDARCAHDLPVNVCG